MKDARPGSAGMAVDSAGNVAYDPSANVLSLVDAAVRRQDDLRLAQNALAEEREGAMRREIALRAEHAKELRDLESRRLDAIRQVDVLAVSTAADRAQAAIQALAVVTTTNAENLRNALTTTAATIATQLANTVSQINDRISMLERSSYEGKGKSALADPMMAELLTEVKALRTSGGLRRRQERRNQRPRRVACLRNPSPSRHRRICSQGLRPMIDASPSLAACGLGIVALALSGLAIGVWLFRRRRYVGASRHRQVVQIPANRT